MEQQPQKYPMDDMTLHEYRGVINTPGNKGRKYFIINEIQDSPPFKIFSGCGAEVGVEDSKVAALKEAYLIKYLDKEFFENNVLSRLNIRGENIQAYYDNLRNTYKNYSKLKFKSQAVQKLYDFIENESGIYFILEFCEFSLYDYANYIKEPLKNSKYPIELKLRGIISEILTGFIEMHKFGLYFGASLNLDEIQVKEAMGSGGKAKFQIKLPNPFLSKIMTFVSLGLEKEKDFNDDNFPSFLSPELYIKTFQAKVEEEKSSNIYEYYANWSNLMEFINDNLDKWELGVLLYQLLFDDNPFTFTNYQDAYSKCINSKNLAYFMKPWKISVLSLNIIEQCLKYEPKSRIQLIQLETLALKIKEENKRAEILEKELKNRMENPRKSQDFAKFYTSSEIDNEIENYGKIY